MHGDIKDAKKLLDLLNTEILVEKEQPPKPLTEKEFNQKWDQLATTLNDAFKSLKPQEPATGDTITNDKQQL